MLATSKTQNNPIDSNAIRIKSKLYKKYSLTDLGYCVLEWVLNEKRKGMKGYCKICKIPRSTLQYYLKEIPQFKDMMVSDELNLMTAERVLIAILTGRN